MASTYGYATLKNIKMFISNLTSSDLNDNQLERFISRAEVKINSILAQRYTVPFTSPIPELVTQITEELSVYYILRTLYSGDNVNKNDNVTQWKDDAMNNLQKIVEREIKIIDSSGDEVTENTTIQTGRSAYTPVFDLDEDINWKVDDDLTTAIASDRE